MFDDVGTLLGLVLRLEADRVASAMAVGREAGVTVDDVASIDQEIDVILGGLDRRGVMYPGHVLATEYQLSGGEYAILQLALMPHHAPDALERIVRALGDQRSKPHLTHALKLFGSSVHDLEHFRRMLESMPLCDRKLILLEPINDGDPELVVSEAVLELLSLS